MLRRILLSSFINVSIALQSQLANQQRHAAANTWQRFKDDWAVQYDAFQTDVTFRGFSCNSKEYYDYVYMLPAFSLSSLKIAPNTRILFYGTSNLHEVLQNILIANADTLIKDGPLGGFEGQLLQKHDSWGFTGYMVQWNFTMNSTIVEIQNHQPMQLSKNIDQLRNFMTNHYFDIAFFMNPHPDCGFNHRWPATSPSCECLLSGGDPMTCDKQFDGATKGERWDVRPQWDVINEAMKGRVYEVEAWTVEKRTWFHADDEHTIHTYPILENFACNVEDNCTNRHEANGHQCQPGRVALVSQMVMNKAREELQKMWLNTDFQFPSSSKMA